jgi:hypothetical protein
MKAKITPLYGVSKVRMSCSRPKKHQHRCPLCRKIKMETNEACGMSIDHVFACVLCLQDYLLRLNLDMDVILDVCLD